MKRCTYCGRHEMDDGVQKCVHCGMEDFRPGRASSEVTVPKATEGWIAKSELTLAVVLCTIVWGYLVSVLFGRNVWAKVFEWLIASSGINPFRGWLVLVLLNFGVAAPALVLVIRNMKRLRLRGAGRFSCTEYVGARWWIDLRG